MLQAQAGKSLHPSAYVSTNLVAHSTPGTVFRPIRLTCLFLCGRYHFCLARIELLPLQLREEVLQFQVKTAAEQSPASMTYIVSAGHDSVMTSMSWLPVAQVDLSSTVSFRHQAQVSHKLDVFTGPAGSGKTHAIQADLAAAAAGGRQTVCLSLNETPTPAAFIKAFSGLDYSADSSLTSWSRSQAMLHLGWSTSCYFRCWWKVWCQTTALGKSLHSHRLQLWSSLWRSLHPF